MNPKRQLSHKSSLSSFKNLQRRKSLFNRKPGSKDVTENESDTITTSDLESSDEDDDNSSSNSFKKNESLVIVEEEKENEVFSPKAVEAGMTSTKKKEK